MNLRVNLILEHEKRSASKLTLKFILVVITILAIIVVIFPIGKTVYTLAISTKESSHLKYTFENLKPQQEKAVYLRKLLAEYKDMIDEIEGWYSTKINWQEILAEIQKICPTNIQFTSLNITHSINLDEKKIPVKYYNMAISGKACFENAESSIESLVQSFKQIPIFTNLLSDVKIDVKFDTSHEASKFDRLFTIECIFKPRIVK